MSYACVYAFGCNRLANETFRFTKSSETREPREWGRKSPRPDVNIPPALSSRVLPYPLCPLPPLSPGTVHLRPVFCKYCCTAWMSQMPRGTRDNGIAHIRWYKIDLSLMLTSLQCASSSI
ncbi:hypothetical protein PUN28_018146 [Cardiocondyla obscurior]|uniref:Uncharacterized protein n=1 Tax=Cardiocondyla obscurior TaxID=286306 RepID=A0AAW2EJZ9_9HYME